MKRESLRQLSLYLVVGVMTTLINIASYFCLTRLLGCAIMPATAIAWVVAVMFAFVANKWVVFRARNLSPTAVFREMVAFFSCRLATGLIDTVAMGFFVEVLGFPDVAMKALANCLIIVGNYLASKYVVFRKITSSGA